MKSKRENIKSVSNTNMEGLKKMLFGYAFGNLQNGCFPYKGMLCQGIKSLNGHIAIEGIGRAIKDLLSKQAPRSRWFHS